MSLRMRSSSKKLSGIAISNHLSFPRRRRNIPPGRAVYQFLPIIPHILLRISLLHAKIAVFRFKTGVKTALDMYFHPNPALPRRRGRLSRSPVTL